MRRGSREAEAGTQAHSGKQLRTTMSHKISHCIWGSGGGARVTRFVVRKRVPHTRDFGEASNNPANTKTHRRNQKHDWAVSTRPRAHKNTPTKSGARLAQIHNAREHKNTQPKPGARLAGAPFRGPSKSTGPREHKNTKLKPEARPDGGPRGPPISTGPANAINTQRKRGARLAETPGRPSRPTGPRERKNTQPKPGA